jgi:hypothetical protein
MRASHDPWPDDVYLVLEVAAMPRVPLQPCLKFPRRARPLGPDVW